uniref:RRM domain-containing protein n=1 Tax=Ditylenchus dipsaci TaxID=166011 RepID=A0A915CV48_9BILA
MLYDCFSKFGSVVTVNISHKLDTGYPTLYGYATFSSPNEASKFLLSGPHVVDGKEISIMTLDERQAPEKIGTSVAVSSQKSKKS